MPLSASSGTLSLMTRETSGIGTSGRGQGSLGIRDLTLVGFLYTRWRKQPLRRWLLMTDVVLRAVPCVISYSLVKV